VADVDPADVVTLTAEGDDGAVAALTVPLITTLAKAYTRGRGFVGNVPNSEIAAVITTAAARFVANPKQASEARTVGPFIRDHRTRGFEGWTLAEQIVLNRYRVRAM
jgi:hypothetical protein